MLAKLSLLLTPVLLSACAPINGPTSTNQEGALVGKQAFSVVAQGNTSPVGVGEFIYTDAEAWRAVQESIRDLHYDPSAANETMLAAAVNANTGGYTVRFEEVTILENGDVRAEYIVHQPGPGCMVTQALTTPFQIIAVPGLLAGEVEFVQRGAMYNC